MDAENEADWPDLTGAYSGIGIWTYGDDFVAAKAAQWADKPIPYRMILDETNPSTTEYPGPLQATFDKIIASGYDEISTLFERTFKGYVKLTESTASIGNM